MNRDKQAKSAALPEDRIAKTARRPRRFTIPFRIFLGLLLALAVIALGAYLFYHWWLAEPENVRAFAQRKIAPLFPGADVTIGAADFSLFGGLDLFQVKVTEEGSGFEMIRLNHLHVDFDLGRLTRPTLLIRNVAAEDLFIDLVRYDNGDWNLSLPVTSFEPAAHSPFATPFTISLQGAFLSIDDQYDGYAVSFPVDRASALCNDRDFRVWRTSLDFGGGLLGQWRIGAEFDVPGKSLHADLNVIDIDLGKGLRTRMPARAREVYDKFEPSGLSDIEGWVDFTEADGWKWRIQAKLKGCAGRFYKFPVRASNLEGTALFTENGMDSLDIAGEASGAVMGVQGRSRGYGKDAAVELTVETAGMLMSDELLAALPERTRNIIEQFNPQGPANVKAELKRPPGPQKPYSVAMVIEPQGMSVTYEKFPMTLHEVFGRLTYAHGTLEVGEVAGRRGGMQVFCSGTVRDLNLEPTVNMRVVATAVGLTEELRDILPEDARRFWNAMAPSGHVDSEVVLAKIPGEPLALSTTIRLRGVAANCERFPYALKNGRGEFTLEKGRFSSAEGLTFEHGEATINVAGSADLSTGEADLEIGGADVPLDDDLRNALPAEWLARLESFGLAGVADVVLSLSRDPDGSLEPVEIKAQLAQARIRAEKAPLPVGAAQASFAWLPGSVEVSGLDGWLYDDSAPLLFPVLRLAYIARPPTRISAAGGYNTVDGEVDWDVSFDAQDLFADAALLRRLPAGLGAVLAERDLSGYMDVRGGVDGVTMGDVRQSSFSISADCGDVQVVSGARFSRVCGRIDFEGETRADACDFVGRGDLHGLFLDDRSLGQTRFVLEKEGRNLFVHEFETHAFGGTLGGSGRYAGAPASGYAFSIEFQDLAIERILGEIFSFEKEGLKGSAAGSLKISCPTGEPGDVMGTCEAVVTQGALWEVPAILAVFNVLNLKIPERSQFTRARLVCEFARDRIMVREFSMSSEPATILGTGSITFDGELDMIFHSHPGRIPVVSMLAGELGKQIVRAHLSGSFEDPAVALVPSGPFGAVINLLKAPFRERGE